MYEDANHHHYLMYEILRYFCRIYLTFSAAVEVAVLAMITAAKDSNSFMVNMLIVDSVKLWLCMHVKIFNTL